MAGTDRTRPAVTGGPAIVLVEPQLAENIGTAARAMFNFGLDDLRLVRPRDGWPSERARAVSSGADAVIDKAQVFDSVEAAIADAHHVLATTARPRGMAKPIQTPDEAGIDMRRRIAAGETVAVLFGPERTGLHSDDVALARAILSVPVNPAFASLNLAQAVLILGYEWFKGVDVAPPAAPVAEGSRPANWTELLGLFEHLERELDEGGFLHPPEKRPTMVRNLRTIFERANLTEQEVRTLRGVVTALTHPNGRKRAGREE